MNARTSRIQSAALSAVATPPELTIALSVLVPFSVLLILVISVSVPAAILKRRKKVETNQDYTIHADTGKPNSRSAAHPTPSQHSHPTPKKDDDLEPSHIYAEIPTSEHILTCCTHVSHHEAMGLLVP